MTDFGKKAAADLVKVAREIRESSTSSMHREDGGHFSFKIPARVVPAGGPASKESANKK